MTILTISNKGTIKLPKDALKHLRNAKHLQIRLNAHGATLTPIFIQKSIDVKEVPSK